MTWWYLFWALRVQQTERYHTGYGVNTGDNVPIRERTLTNETTPRRLWGCLAIEPIPLDLNNRKFSRLPHIYKKSLFLLLASLKFLFFGWSSLAQKTGALSSAPFSRTNKTNKKTNHNLLFPLHRKLFTQTSSASQQAKSIQLSKAKGSR